MAAEIRKMKKEPGEGIAIFGSGSVVSQLAEEGLIDEYQVMIHPVAIGNGTPFLKDVHKKIELELTKTKTFKSGVVLLWYQPKNK